MVIERSCFFLVQCFVRHCLLLVVCVAWCVISSGVFVLSIGLLSCCYALPACVGEISRSRPFDLTILTMLTMVLCAVCFVVLVVSSSISTQASVKTTSS